MTSSVVYTTQNRSDSSKEKKSKAIRVNLSRAAREFKSTRCWDVAIWIHSYCIVQSVLFPDVLIGVWLQFVGVSKRTLLSYTLFLVFFSP